MNEASTELILALRRANEALASELKAAEAKIAIAQNQAQTVRDRYQLFRAQLDEICAVSGIPISDVVMGDVGGQPTHEITAASPTLERNTIMNLIMNPLALPCRPKTQRWYAGQALHQLGGEASITDIAAKMRELGYEHSRAPSSATQLEQSLAALPSQVAWVTAGQRPGHLCLRLA